MRRILMGIAAASLIFCVGGCTQDRAGQKRVSYRLVRWSRILRVGPDPEILLVIDDSPAVKPFQAALARNLKSLVQDVLNCIELVYVTP